MAPPEGNPAEAVSSAGVGVGAGVAGGTDIAVGDGTGVSVGDAWEAGVTTGADC